MMDEFKSRFVDALCRPDVVMGIEGVIEPLLDQHREEFTHIMNQMINPLTLALKKQKEDVNLNGAISTHQMGEQGHRLCFKEVRSTWIGTCHRVNRFVNNVNWQQVIFRFKFKESIATCICFYFEMSTIVPTGVTSIQIHWTPFQWLFIWKRGLGSSLIRT